MSGGNGAGTHTGNGHDPSRHPGFNDQSAADIVAALYDATAEQAVLGMVLIENWIFPHIGSVLRPSQFGNKLHSDIFVDIGETIERGDVANPATVGPHFALDPRLQPAGGGTKYLARLAEAAVQPGMTRSALDDALSYARTVAELSRVREAILAGEELKAAVANFKPGDGTSHHIARARWSRRDIRSESRVR